MLNNKPFICETCTRYSDINIPCVVNHMTEAPELYPRKHRKHPCTWYYKKENVRKMTYDELMRGNAKQIQKINQNKDNYEPLQ